MSEELAYVAHSGFEEFFEKVVFSPEDGGSRELRLFQDRLYPDFKRMILQELEMHHFPLLESRVTEMLPPPPPLLDFSDVFRQNFDGLLQRVTYLEIANRERI